MDIPLAPCERMLKKTRFRVSDDAITEFAQLLEEITADIASEAAAVAKSKKNSTVHVGDVLAAKRKVLK
jgi:histone H3/H4